MDLLPNQVIRFAQLGIQEVLQSQTIWTCASCLTCVARCPKAIDLPRLMEALRILSLEKDGSQMNSEALLPELLEELPQLAIIGGFRKLSR